MNLQSKGGVKMSQEKKALGNLYHKVHVGRKTGNKTVTESTVVPTGLFSSEENKTLWLQAENDGYPGADKAEKGGKWVVFVEPEDIDRIWPSVKNEINNGTIWHAKTTLSTDEPGKYVILFSVPNISDNAIFDDPVRDTYQALIQAGIVQPDQNIKFKSDAQTVSGDKDARLFDSAQLRDALSIKQPQEQQPLKEKLKEYIDSRKEEESTHKSIFHSHKS